MFPKRNPNKSSGACINDYVIGDHDSIMITTGVLGNNLVSFYIPIGYGFYDAFCTDVDGDDQDEIVKINTITTANSAPSSFCLSDTIVQDSIVVTVFKVNSAGTLDTLRYGGV